MTNAVEHSNKPRTTPGRSPDRIVLKDDAEIRAWCQSLGCTEVQLRVAVQAAGSSSDKVRHYVQTTWAVGTATKRA